jgi:hypothetical protein
MGIYMSYNAVVNMDVRGALALEPMVVIGMRKLVRMQPKYHHHHLGEDAVAKDDHDHSGKEPLAVGTP